MERIRVVHVITMLELGGAQQNTLDTVERLDPLRFEKMLVAGTGGVLDERARSLRGVRVVFLPELVREIRPGSDLAAFRRLRRLFRETRPHIVHTHSSKAGIVGRWAAWAARVPIVVHSIHGYAWSPWHGVAARAAYVAAEWLTARVTDHFVAVSRANLDEGVQRGFFREEGATLIRSGFDLAAFSGANADRAAFRRGLGFPERAPVVGMIACLKPQKAPEDFVRIAARVHASMPDVRFVLVGDGELRPRVEEEIERHGLGGAVALLGWRKDVPEILVTLDVLVLTSLWEGLPRVVPQAQAAGVPVVATAVNGTPETILDNQTGYLFRPHDIGSAADKIIFLLADGSERERVVRNARGGLNGFSVETLVREQERLYERLLREQGRPGPASD